MSTVFIAGLPGCGKTAYLAKMAQEGWDVFDDFHAGAANDSSEIPFARRYTELIGAIVQGKNVMVSDLSYCDPARRQNIAAFFAGQGVEIEWQFFANDPGACEQRVKSRNRPSVDEDLRKLAEFAAVYEIPDGATVLPLGGIRLKVSLDYDGTMWSHMAFARNLMWSFKAQGHLVGCLTGHNEECRQADIDLMVARGFPVPDFWFGRTAEYVPKNGSVYKSVVILRENIDMHFDDCDYGNEASLRLFREGLGDKFYKLVIMQPRMPGSVHYE